jgi:hypothetical protein
MLLTKMLIFHVSLEKITCARIWLKMKEKTPLLIPGEKLLPITRFHASITWIGGPQSKQTDLTPALSSTRGVGAHQAVAQPNLGRLGPGLGWPNQDGHNRLTPSTWHLHISPQCQFNGASAILVAERYCDKPINMRGSPPKSTHQDVVLSSLVKLSRIVECR